MRRFVFLLLVLGLSLSLLSAASAQENRPDRQEQRERSSSPPVAPVPAPSPVPAPPPAPSPPPPTSVSSSTVPTDSGIERRDRRADAGERLERPYSGARPRPDSGRERVGVAIPPTVNLPTRASATEAPEAATTLPSYSRPREGRAAVGTAVSRPVGGYHPPGWDWGNYWGYYPWGFGLWSYYYDPFWDWGPDYVGYYGGSAYVATNIGQVKIKVKPSKAQVYVDGYFVGIVDEFDGLFQRLSLPEGPHTIEVRADGLATQTFDVRVTVNRTLTVRGEMQRQP